MTLGEVEEDAYDYKGNKLVVEVGEEHGDDEGGDVVVEVHVCLDLNVNVFLS